MSKADSLTPPRDYLKTYSLSCEPFANTLDGRFFYAGPALMQRLDLLTHLTQFGDSVILVSGPAGSGKTTLLGRFVAQTGKQWRLCLINADEFVQFRQRLGDALGIGDSIDERRILEQWSSRQDASQLLVVVIDNTQLLQPDALQKLCALLSQPEGDRVRLILFGEPEAQLAIKQALDQKDLPCTAQLLELPKLSEEETAAYLMYRLAVAGYSGESPFTATEVRAICKAADGRPAAINRLAHDALLEHQMRARSKRLRPRRPAWMRRPSTWAAASLLVIGIAFYLGWERLQPETATLVGDRQQQPEMTEREIPLPLPEPAVPPQAATPAVAPPAKMAAAPPESVEQPAARAAAPQEPPTTPPLPVATPAPAIVSPSEQPPAATPPDALVATAEPDREAQPALLSTSEAAPANPETRTQAAISSPVEPADENSTLPAPVAEAPPPAETGAPAATPDTAAPTPPSGETIAPRREAWLLRQPAGHYSLQLLGSRQEDSILSYIRQNRLDPQRCAYYRGDYQGGAWFVLMYGVFPDRESALAARTALPARVQKEKPWPRSLASVHAAIRAPQ